MESSVTNLEEMRERFANAYERGRLERRVEILEAELREEKAKRIQAERERDSYRSRLAISETEAGIYELAEDGRQGHATLPFKLAIVRGARRIEAPACRTLPIARVVARKLVAEHRGDGVMIVRDGKTIEQIGVSR